MRRVTDVRESCLTKTRVPMQMNRMCEASLIFRPVGQPLMKGEAFATRPNRHGTWTSGRGIVGGRVSKVLSGTWETSQARKRSEESDEPIVATKRAMTVERRGSTCKMKRPESKEGVPIV